MNKIGYPINTFETPRSLLHEVTPEVWTYMHTNCTPEAIKAFGGYTDAELLVEKEKFKAGLVSYHFSFRIYMMEDKATGDTIGRIGYHTWQPMHFKAEIGYGLFDNAHKNKGYMKEAMKPVLEQGFGAMALNRVVAMIGPANIASINLITRYGYTNEGVLRQDYCRDGIIYDSASYSLLKSEYEVLKRNW